MVKYVLIALFSGIFSAFSQVLLKKSSNTEHETGLREYLNLYVISGYALVVACMVLMIFSYRGLPFKYGVVIESLVYFYVMILDKIFFNEEITSKKVINAIRVIHK